MEDQPTTVRYLTKDLLITLNGRAVANKRRQALQPEFVEQLPADRKFPVVFAMVHNDREMRLVLTFDGTTCGYLDVTFDDFFSLPKVEV